MLSGLLRELGQVFHHQKEKADGQSGPINLYTLRHAPGHMVHTLRGHQSVVSCLSILPGEQGLLSGSWDGTIRVSTSFTRLS